MIAADRAGADGDRDLGVLHGFVGYHLRRASAAFSADFADATAGTGIRQVLFGILAVVETAPAIAQGRVGRLLGIQRANMVALINELVDMGLVERRVAAEDRRALALSLTAKGHAVLDECKRRLAAHEERMLADLSPPERALLIEWLARISRRDGSAPPAHSTANTSSTTRSP